MVIERITREEYTNANRKFAQLEGKWMTDEKLINAESLKSLFDRQYKTALSTTTKEKAEELEWGSVLERLKNGKVVADMFCLYRVKNDNPKCPRCGSSYPEGEEALSRRDNSTSICSDCGVLEAFADFK